MRTIVRVPAPVGALLLLLLLPLATAGPVHEADVSPPPGTGEGYYLRATVYEPEAPRDALEGDDCAGWRPQGVATSMAPHLKPLLWSPPDPTTMTGVAPWFPTCVAVAASADDAYHLCRMTGTPCLMAKTPLDRAPYAAWNVRDGRVLLDPGAPDVTAKVVRVPVGLAANCEDCPPGNLAILP